MWKASGVIEEGSDSFPIVEEIDAKKRGICCAVYSKPLKLTLKGIPKSFFLKSVNFEKVYTKFIETKRHGSGCRCLKLESLFNLYFTFIF